MVLRLKLLGFVALIAAVSGSSPAMPQDFDNVLRGALQPGFKLQHTLDALRQRLDRLDTDGNGLSIADAEAATKRQLAAARSAALAALMPSDLDGNQVVTPDEIAKGLAEKIGRRCNCDRDNELDENTRSFIAEKMAFDANRDGALSVEEIIASVDPERLDDRSGRALRNIKSLMAFDANKDGMVTEDEIDTAAAGEFKRVDKDGNGVIDIDEHRIGR